MSELDAESSSMFSALEKGLGGKGEDLPDGAKNKLYQEILSVASGAPSGSMDPSEWLNKGKIVGINASVSGSILTGSKDNVRSVVIYDLIAGFIRPR